MDQRTRLKSIGGSDALRIMKGDWHKLWLEKTGRAEQADLSDVLQVQLGIWTEEFNVRLFEKDRQVEVTRDQRYHYNRNNIPLRGTLDGVFIERGVRYGLECKHTNEFNTLNKQLENYMPQLQLYIEVANLEAIYFANIFGNSRYEYVKVSKDEVYLEKMMVHIKEFWDLFYSDQAPPENVSEINISINQTPIDDMISRDASSDNHFVSIAHDYVTTKEAARVNAQAAKDLKAMVATNEREVYCDTLNIKRAKNGSLRINVKESSNG